MNANKQSFGMVFIAIGMSVAGICGLCAITNSEAMDDGTAKAIWLCVALVTFGISGMIMMSGHGKADQSL